MTDSRTLDDLLRTLNAEAAGEPMAGQIAVMCVIRNRVNDPHRWPNTYSGVVRQSMQFSCWNDGRPALPTNGLARRWMKYLIIGIVEDRYPDTTAGANHYYNPFISKPSWGQSVFLKGELWRVTLWPGKDIGQHIFLKL